MSVCGLCRRRPEVVPRDSLVPDVISDLYSNWDQYATGGLCEWCVWAHRHKPLRARPHLVALDATSATPLKPSGVRKALTEGWPARTALCVPISRKKHVAPFAKDLAVNIDDLAFPWHGDDADLVPVVEALRAAGAGETWLAELEPPWPLVRKHGIAIRDQWLALDGWRRHEPHKLTVAILATRKDKDMSSDSVDDTDTDG